MKTKLLTSISVLLALAGCSEDQTPTAVTVTVDAEAGKVFVEEHCTGCHTMEGSGKTDDIPNLAGQPQEYLISAMDAYREGSRHHSALQEIISGTSDEQVRNIAAYFAGLPPTPAKPEQQAPEEIIYDEGSKIAAACVECHGERGQSTMPNVPNLAGQHPIYLIVATQEYASGARDNAEKEAMLSGLDNVDIEKMAMYFAAQTPEPRDPPPFGDPASGEAQTALCGGCHGAHGVSQDPMVPNLAGQEPHYLVNAIKAYRDHERNHEDMIADKSDSEIEDIAAYYAVQTGASTVSSGTDVASIVSKCDRCHGAALGESTMVVPMLYGQKQDYLLRVMQQYRDEERGSSMMHKMSAGYSDAVLADIAEYYATHVQPN